MATRSNIFLKLNQTEINHPGLKADKAFAMSHNIDEKVYDTKMTPVKTDKDTKYLGIYCHFDGYPEYMGALLTQHYNNYNDILNLVLCGDTSSIDEKSTETYVRRGERWTKDPEKGVYHSVAPKALPEIKELSGDTEFIYLFEDNRWKFTEVPWTPDEEKTPEFLRKDYLWKDVLKYLDHEI